MGGKVFPQPAPSEPGAGEFYSISTPAVTTFGFQGVTPPSRVYIGLNDLLFISGAATSGAATITVRGRLLRVDGQIIPLEIVLALDGSRTLITKQVQLAEGYLLALTVQSGIAVNAGDSVWVQAGIQRSSSSGLQFFETLVSGYASRARVLSYPETGTESFTPGQGALRSITGTAPAAGAEISETVPAGARWRLAAFRFALTTAIAVANRIPSLAIDDGVNVLYQVPTDFTETASLTITYNAATNGGRWGNANSLVNLPLPIGFTMAAGWRIRTITTALQAADAYTAPQYAVEEFLSPT